MHFIPFSWSDVTLNFFLIATESKLNKKSTIYFSARMYFIVNEGCNDKNSSEKKVAEFMVQAS